MSSNTMTLYEVTVTHETDEALFCIIEGEEVSVPKSVIDDESEVFEKGDEGMLMIDRWFADKKGWV